jgi:beta-phosphoglucomutase
MDGVLCDSEPFICEAACRMFAELYATAVRAEDFLPFVGAGENRYLGGVAEKHGLTIDIDAAKRRTYEIYLQIIKGRLEPMHGVHEFVAECRRRGLKLAVATSADYVKMAGNLAEIRLPPERFDACINGLDVERKKPNPDIFLLAARRLGLTAEECLVIEDAPNGVQAAKAAGSKCLALTSSFSEGQLAACGADWIAPDLASVPDGVFEMG